MKRKLSDPKDMEFFKNKIKPYPIKKIDKKPLGNMNDISKAIEEFAKNNERKPSI